MLRIFNVYLYAMQHDFPALEQIDENCYILYKVDEDCGLLEFFHKRNIEFCQGCAFYEFQYNKVEDININSGIILIDKVGYIIKVV